MYAAYQTFRFIFSNYTTENAYGFEVARVYTTSGVLIRDEAPIDKAADETIRYTLDEAGKFISTTQIALSYSDKEAADKARNLERLKEEQRMLTDILLSIHSKTKPDIVTLSDQIYSTLRSLTINTTVDKAKDTEQIRLQLIGDISRIQAAVNSTSVNCEERLDELAKQIEAIEPGIPITVNDDGYFSRFVDGYEQQFTPALLDTIRISQLDTALGQNYPYQSESFGKIIHGYTWYYVTTIPLSEAQLFQPGTAMTITFAGSDEQRPIGGWVQSITEDSASKRAMLVIESDAMSVDTVSRRTATVKLGFDDFKGIRFSKKAMRIQDGVKGVYVKGKSAIRFKKVNIVYTGTDFYLSKLDYDSEEYLNIFDVIIVEGTNLYDGKTLE
ncbi:MAG: HlyD family efflux transporter periplasmic adaptor subunit [Angelakisella sp.]